MSKRRWAVVLDGSEPDLREWGSQLTIGFDPWIEIDHGRRILHSTRFDQLRSADEAAKSAAWLVHVLVGAVAVQGRRTNVRAGHLVEYRPDGTRLLHMTISISVNSLMEVGRLPSIPKAGSEEQAEPTASLVQKWVATAAMDPAIADTLMFFGGSQDWADIYKAVESLELKYGGERGLLERMSAAPQKWPDPKRVKLLKRSANAGPRHPERKYPPPDNPMPLNEARDLVSKLILAAIAD